MRILLDECAPWPIYKLLPDHQCMPAQRRGWGGVKNGELLRLANREFDLFMTADQNIRFQQKLTGYQLAVIQLSTNKWRRILAAAALIQAAVASIRPGEFRRLEIP